MIASSAVTMFFGIPLFLIGIPATLIPVYVWARFARTPKGRR
jgi:hypothetical protein